MYKLLHVVGTRPQIIKSAALSNAIKTEFGGKIQDIKIDTGQHYDANLADVFYKELGIGTPSYILNIRDKHPALQLSDMIAGIYNVVEKEKPHGILVYGDTLSTVAGSMIAHTTKLPLYHVEAGLRSHNFDMPEEFNRIVADRSSTLLFVPTKKAVQNLVKENYRFPADEPHSVNQPGIILTGDIMFDNYKHYSAISSKPAAIKLSDGEPFVLLTMHRNYNADSPAHVEEILRAINDAASAKKAKVVFPVHPRTLKQLQENNKALWNELDKSGIILFTEPLPYLQTMWALKNCSLVLTDSGGLQKEAYFSGKHCIILRPETEWTELLDSGSAVTVWHKRELIIDAFNEFFGKTFQPGNLYGDGNAAGIICNAILQHHQSIT